MLNPMLRKKFSPQCMDDFLRYLSSVAWQKFQTTKLRGMPKKSK
ncbi:hypothetical protein BURCENBC7_AP6116 [Burkholderia cenocepacia BC7]|nr:hypothetical protein BURCENK562V_C2097 [Burkholderia cenocepacia K56-2Valvano]ERI30696.1 hypothetical protein BURCENBC7_AP6116 [Burkholderia cenocepacia BC7]